MSDEPIPDKELIEQLQATVAWYEKDRNRWQDAQEAIMRRAMLADDLEAKLATSGWQPIETAPIGRMVWLWGPLWRHAFPGRRNGEDGAVYVDTCEPEARGWQAVASHWMPLPEPPAA